MKKTFFTVSIIILMAAGCGRTSSSNPPAPAPAPALQQKAKPMMLTSPEFSEGREIPKKYSCKGANSNPPLTISGIPAQAQSLALILHDPDAPVAGGFTHWVMYDIDPHTTDILENTIPAGSVQGNNSSKKPGYTGPCPPSGTHHYHFTVYALDTQLHLAPGADKTALEKAMQGHILSQAALVGIFSH